MAEDHKLAQLTYNFLNGINANSIQLTPEDPNYLERSPFALEAGFYFEARMYAYLKELIEGKSSGTPMDELTSVQQRAVTVFATSVASGNAEGIKFEKAVSNAALNAARAVYLQMEDILQEAINEDYVIEVNNIAVSEDSAAGNPFGDLEIKIGKMTYTFELKWQSSRDYPTRWFSQTADKSLFENDTFYNYLRNQVPDKYWNYTNRYWERDVTTSGLMEFLEHRFKGDHSEEIAFLLRKGKSENLFNNNNIKCIIHAGYAGMQITGFDSLVRKMKNGVDRSTEIQQLVPGKNLVLYQNGEGKNIAGFGVDSYQGPKTKKRSDANFTFAFYVSQKYLNAKNVIGDRFNQ